MVVTGTTRLEHSPQLGWAYVSGCFSFFGGFEAFCGQGSRLCHWWAVWAVGHAVPRVFYWGRNFPCSLRRALLSTVQGGVVHAMVRPLDVQFCFRTPSFRKVVVFVRLLAAGL